LPFITFVFQGKEKSLLQIHVGPLGRPRRRWKDNIKMDLKEIGTDGANWIRLAQDRVQWWAFVNKVMNLRVP
jgi:hypothetical protein